ncbi:MAG: hypothetical protein K8S94_08940 [Planctomycetia bacterium]|nr:hypothetical protein [Planctomycetia bacterium]
MTGCWLRVRAVIAAAVVVLVGASATRGEDPVLVSVTGPLVGRVGERASFEVELVNRSGKPLQNLRVIDYFDKGFHHEASASPIEQKGTIDLMPGTARRLTLDFLLDEPGRQCHRVEILDQSHVFVGGATHCVEVQPVASAAAPRVATPPAPVAAPATVAAVPPPLAATPPLAVPPPLATTPPLAAATTPAAVTAPIPVPLPRSTAASTIPVPAAAALELDLEGPAETLSDGVVSYVATVKNKGAGAASPTTLEFSWDDHLTPLEASDGYNLVASKVSWNLPALEPGGQLKRQINLRAKAPADAYRDSPATRSCVRAVLGGFGGGAMVADESCVLISSSTPRPRVRTPAEAGLKLSLADLDDPVRPGDSTTLVCTVTNGGTEPTGRLDLLILLPDQARLDSDRTVARVRIDDSRVSFDPIQAIPPGGQRSFEITYRLPSGGTGRASAILSSAELDGTVERSCQTSFLEP